MENQFRRTFWVSCAVICGSFLLFGGGLWWLSRDVALQAQKVTEHRAFITSHIQAVELLAELKRIAPQVKQYEEKLHLLLPERDELLDFPRWLDGVARATKIGLIFSFQGATTAPQGDKAGSVGFTLNATGSYGNLVNFFREVEVQSSRFLVSFDGFDLNRGEGEYRALIQGRVFFR